ncbi:MAG: DUF4093 domain-containing protein [Clostridia bacterium]|nr:DUF4093 domain-containing protein [Clostridia bacterium]
MSENNSAPKRPRLRLPLIVEGRYDKSAVLGMVDGTVITTDGFGIFNSEEKRALIKRLSGDGILLLTDSDGGGRQIRAFVSGLVPRDRLIHLYIPELSGKERRKRHAGAAGLLGVEGVGGEVLRRVLSPYLDTEGAPASVGDITPTELYSLGLTGSDGSQALRDRIAGELSLPMGMSAKAFLAALNLLITRDELVAFFT